MPEPQDRDEQETRGRSDWVSVLYILGGIPAIIAYVVIAMTLARFFNFPA
jgi:hypothetical protein